MQNDIKTQLERLNSILGDANGDVDIIKTHSEEYFNVLRQYLPQLMQEIVDENDKQKAIALLQSIFPAQSHLMSTRIMASVQIDDDLWEVAKDFDNDDPLAYDYLLEKIKRKGYILQQANTKQPYH